MNNWWHRRQKRQAAQEEALQQLREEYQERLEAHDPDALEISRDWADNDGAPWRLEVSFALAFVILFASVTLLIILFEGIQALVGE